MSREAAAANESADGIQANGVSIRIDMAPESDRRESMSELVIVRGAASSLDLSMSNVADGGRGAEES